MDISKIEMVLKAIETGSLTKAAEELDYTPSALSQILTGIEDEIGTKLIKRTYSGITVEEGKEDIIKLLEDIVKTKNHIIKIASDKKTGKSTLTIATYASVSKYVLPKAVKEFKKLHTGVDINIIVGEKLGVIYKKGLADIVFSEKTQCKGVIWEKLFTDTYIAVLPEKNKCSSDSISRDELLGDNFILAKDIRISNYVKSNNLSSDISNNSSDDASVIQLVKEGMFVSILPSLTVTDVKGIRKANLDPPFERVLGLTYSEADYNNNVYLRDFIEILRGITKDKR